MWEDYEGPAGDPGSWLLVTAILLYYSSLLATVVIYCTLLSYEYNTGNGYGIGLSYVEATYKIVVASLKDLSTYRTVPQTLQSWMQFLVFRYEPGRYCSDYSSSCC